ncbi:MAG: 50S ribosomal protein L16 3-hydroxylase YcfD [Idiomarinaceae bacterium HL-53]|nr:MAG: 50S ribosomal protein L16 3-hydroxylase YcfD [Idiomarinaceae bacterium HL-53]CUS48972.1 50S ribosomal protein L16 3-hydroxylase [Idiomarinaceae bacterium HL-53]
MKLANFDPAAFKRDNWQQQPRVFRQVLPNFKDLLSADELAGIALELGVDSRIVQNNHGTWNLVHGPFDAYDTLGDSHWTLLVQAVNEHYPPTRPLLRAFRWLPAWRIDDLMISYATPQGGVGPHIDQYDVFIIQGEGSRRWRVGPKGNYQTRLPHPDLSQIEKFEAIIDEELNAGDMIYIPAGFPHEGTAISASLSYSVGFRAPSQAEWLSALADHALEHELLGKRYRDNNATLLAQEQLTPDDLPVEAIQAVQEHLINALQDESLVREVVAKLLSTNPRPPLQFWPENTVQQDELTRILELSNAWIAAPGLRWLFSHDETQDYVYVQGNRFRSDEHVRALLTQFSKEDEVHSRVIQNAMKRSADVRSIYLWLYNEGFVVEVDEES